MRYALPGLFALLLCAACKPAVDAQPAPEPQPADTCTTLKEGDAWYPQWTMCCDLENGKSQWTNADGTTSEWERTCGSWGVGPDAE